MNYQVNYQEIAKANSEIKTVDLKGKGYAMVSERVTAFRKVFPAGFITTEIIEHDGTSVLMQAEAGMFTEDGTRIVLGTGYAQEVKGRGMVNGTSYIENCETSAVGRALGFLGLGVDGGSICSAEELTNAVLSQDQSKMNKDKLRKEIIGLCGGDMDKLSSFVLNHTRGMFNAIDNMDAAWLADIKLGMIKAIREGKF